MWRRLMAGVVVAALSGSVMAVAGPGALPARAQDVGCSPADWQYGSIIGASVWHYDSYQITETETEIIHWNEHRNPFISQKVSCYYPEGAGTSLTVRRGSSVVKTCPTGENCAFTISHDEKAPYTWTVSLDGAEYWRVAVPRQNPWNYEEIARFPKTKPTTTTTAPKTPTTTAPRPSTTPTSAPKTPTTTSPKTPATTVAGGEGTATTTTEVVPVGESPRGLEVKACGYNAPFIEVNVCQATWEPRPRAKG